MQDLGTTVLTCTPSYIMNEAANRTYQTTVCRMHVSGQDIWADQFLVEIIDPKMGESLPDGEQGELVITTFVKEALPLIRHKIGDLTVKTTSEPVNAGAHIRLSCVFWDVLTIC